MQKMLNITLESDYIARNEDDGEIDIGLGAFKFRKNVSAKKVAKKINYYQLLELICSMEREGGEAICGGKEPYHCAVNSVLSKMGVKRW